MNSFIGGNNILFKKPLVGPVLHLGKGFELRDEITPLNRNCPFLGISQHK